MSDASTLHKIRDWFGFGSADHGHHGDSHHDHADGGGHGHTHGVVDASLATNERGIWAIKWSFVILAIVTYGLLPRLILLVAAKWRDQKVLSGHYKHVDGTSFAAPIVSSVVAQMLEANPRLRPQQCRRILMQTARGLPGIALDRQGWGVVQPRAAVAAARAAG